MLWVSCAVLAREIEAYNIHLVVTKPAPPWLVWLGKWLGVFLLHAMMLLIAFAVILSLVYVRLARGDFPKEELENVQSEVLVGRRAFLPEPVDFRRLAEKEYEQRLATRSLNPAHDKREVMREILRQVRAKSSEIPAGATRQWRFLGVTADAHETGISMRYRVWVGAAVETGQRLTQGVWGVWDPSGPGGRAFRILTQQMMGGKFNELALPGGLVTEDNSLLLTYQNMDPKGKSVIFQAVDGPALLIRVTGFVANYFRAAFLALLQLGFLSALGCTVGAAFSTPVAIFAAVSYLVIGMTVEAAIEAKIPDEFGKYQYKSIVEMFFHRMARSVEKAVVSVDDFDATSDLAKGRLIEFTRMGEALLGLVVLRGGLMAGLGMWILTKRELGTVIRK